MSSLRHRVERLEGPGGGFIAGLAERLDAARRRWREDPEAMRREQEERHRALDDADKAGRSLSRLERRMLWAHRRLEAVSP